MIYLLGWFCLYLTWLLQVALTYQGRFFLFICLLLLAGISFSRGDIGTDTLAYESIFSQILDANQLDGLEPGFVFLAFSLSKFLPIEIAVRSISLLFFVALAWYTYRSDRNEQTLLLLYLLPTFAYQYSMNALRAGLAFCLILLFSQALRCANKKKGLIFSICSLSFHYSALAPLTFIFLTYRGITKRSFIFLTLAMFLVLGTFFIFLHDYFIGKLKSYLSFASPSHMSGVSVLIPLILILTGILFGRLPNSEKVKLFTLGLVSVGVSFLIARFSYAGLRILDLKAYAVPLSILLAYSKHRLPFEKILTGSFALAGIISAAAAFYRFTHTTGSAPWLPYQTWFYGF
jgi:hypothetical protein